MSQTQLDCRANSGDLFVFINRKRTLMKILYYSKGGYCLWSKRLEQGNFHRLISEDEKIALDWAQLQCLIDGINDTGLRFDDSVPQKIIEITPPELTRGNADLY